MPTFRASLIALISLVATPVFAQAPPPDAAPPPDPGLPPPAAAEPAAEPAPPPASEAVPAPPVAGVPAPEPPVPAPLPEPEPEDEKPAWPEKLSVGKSGGFFQPGALLQFWTLYTHSDDASSSTFRLRRAEIRVKGEIAPKLVGYQIMIDAAKTLNFGSGDTLTPPADTSILQDYYITFISDYADVSLGQFKTPISLEGYNSSSKTIFPERSRSSRAFGDRRDIGLRVEKKLGDYFYYYAGLFNGSGLNRTDVDHEKDAALRLEVYPFKGFTLGAMGYRTIGDRDDLARDRIEGDIRYDDHGVILQAEYIRAWDSNNDVEEGEDEEVEGHGGYVAAGVTIIDRIQPVVRVGFLDTNTEIDDNTLMHYEGGLNYLLRAHEMKLSLVGTRLVPDTGANGIEALFAAQVSF
jgi:hypothetical protein